MSETKPTSFNDLKPTELYRSALEDFAIPVDEADKNKKKVLLAAFTESGVTWQDYVAQHPEVAPDEPATAVKENPVEVVEGAPVQEDDVVIRTAEAPKPQVKEKFLIKMVRDNPVFEVKGIRFTSSHPYALVNEGMANYLLSSEDGFRMATPAELREFYG